MKGRRCTNNQRNTNIQNILFGVFIKLKKITYFLNTTDLYFEKKFEMFRFFLTAVLIFLGTVMSLYLNPLCPM